MHKYTQLVMFTNYSSPGVDSSVVFGHMQKTMDLILFIIIK